MIKIFDLPHFKETVRHAKSLGNRAWFSLRDRLRWMSYPYDTPGFAGRNILKIGKDFAPYSFAFALYRNDPEGERFLYNGGLIYYAGAESGCSGPQFSVTTSGDKHARWECHT